MHYSNIEILLVNSMARPQAESEFSVSYRESFAPLGLHCLAEIDRERIAVVDLQFAFPNEETFLHLRSEKIHTVILRVGTNHDADSVRSMVRSLKKTFARAQVGVSGELASTRVACGDFYIHGTGYSCILTALRGEKLRGVCDCMEADSKLALPVPEVAFSESFCFDAPPEKTLHRKTYEIFQPWLGLFEFSDKKAAYPGVKWLSRLGKWMQLSGINELHFRPSGIRPKFLHEIRSIMLNLKIEFAVSFKNFSESELEGNCAGYPLKQVWLYQPDVENAAYFMSGLEIILRSGCCAGLALNTDSIGVEKLPEMLVKADRLAILDLETWRLAPLKKVFMKFWGAHHRFFRRLFSIRTAHELIGFMKTSTVILETLFSTEKGWFKK